jgi:hypothetical protein
MLLSVEKEKFGNHSLDGLEDVARSGPFKLLNLRFPGMSDCYISNRFKESRL